MTRGKLLFTFCVTLSAGLAFIIVYRNRVHSMSQTDAAGLKAFNCSADKVQSITYWPQDLHSSNPRQVGEKIKLVKDGTAWRLTEPTSNIADSEIVKTLLIKLCTVTATDAVELEGKNPLDYGIDLNAPVFETVVEGNQSGTKVYVGNEVPLKPMSRYVKNSTSDKLFIYHQLVLDSLALPSHAIAKNPLTGITATDLAGLELTSAKSHVKIIRSATGFAFSDATVGLVDQENIAKVLFQIFNFKPVAVQEASDPLDGLFNDTTKTTKLHLWDSKGVTTDVSFAEDAGTYWAKTDYGPTVYKISRELFDAIAPGADFFMLLDDFKALKPADVKSIRINSKEYVKHDGLWGASPDDDRVNKGVPRVLQELASISGSEPIIANSWQAHAIRTKKPLHLIRYVTLSGAAAGFDFYTADGIGSDLYAFSFPAGTHLIRVPSTQIPSIAEFK